ncbi:MAG: hypothetical protein IPP77_05455 [Bacteroidetes bacterium]|nr:hypothetical protein [Bacteroidota bacterium]
MKTKILKGVIIIFVASLLITSCKKRALGVCYCHYLSGAKTEYNLTSLTRSQQIDSCYVLDGNAGAFAGDCDLE